MKNVVRIAGLVAATMLLGACGVFGGDDDEELLPLELEDIDEIVKVRNVWSAKVDGDA